MTEQDDSGAGLIVFRWPAPFAVPASKGPLGTVYAERATAGQLQAYIDFEGKTPSAALWQARDRTAELRSHWLQKLNWPDDPATTQAHWIAAGGKDPGAAGLKDRNPSAKTPVRDGPRGRAAGRRHEPPRERRGPRRWPTRAAARRSGGSSSGIATAIRNQLPLAQQPTQVGIYWDKADMSAVPPRPATPDPAHADFCVDVELCAQALAGAPGRRLRLPVSSPSTSRPVPTRSQRTPTRARGPSTNLVDDKGPNLGVVQMISGLILAELHRPADHNDTVLAHVEPTGSSRGRASRPSSRCRSRTKHRSR